MAETSAQRRRLEADGLAIVERDPLACVNLRGQAAEARFMRSVSSVIDVQPPLEPCTSVTGLFGSVLWLGPDEWLVVSESQSGGEITARLRQALHGIPAAVTDVSDARIIFVVSGIRARDVLAKGCSIDLHPRAFPSGRCVQSLLAKAPVLIHASSFQSLEIHVARSFAEYAWAWLENAKLEYGTSAGGK